MNDFNGVPVADLAKGDLTKLLVQVRQKLSCGALSPTSVNWLLLSLELSNVLFEDLPPPVLTYYSYALNEPLYVLSSKSDLIKIPQEYSSSFLLNDILDNVVLVQ